MVLCVTDQDGNILGLYAMPNETEFSLGVAVAKARNTAYYDGPNLQPSDQLAGIPVGTAFTNRTFRYLAEPRYPEGVGSTPGPWSSLNDPGINPATAEDSGPALPASVYMQNSTSELAYAAFDPNSNFREVTTPANAKNQNGVVFFPGSAGVYKNGTGTLIGGFGASGDGVDEDDVATYSAVVGFDPLSAKASRPILLSERASALPGIRPQSTEQIAEVGWPMSEGPASGHQNCREEPMHVSNLRSNMLRIARSLVTLWRLLAIRAVRREELPALPGNALRKPVRVPDVRKWSSPLARPSDTPNYCGYYVGGGAACARPAEICGRGHLGLGLCRPVSQMGALDWWHGGHPQGGGGAYATDHK